MLYVLGLPKLKSVSGLAKQGMELDERLITNPDGFGVEDIGNGFARFEKWYGIPLPYHFGLQLQRLQHDIYPRIEGGLEIINTDTTGGSLLGPQFSESSSLVLRAEARTKVLRRYWMDSALN